MQIASVKSNSDQEYANFSKLRSDNIKTEKKAENDDDKPETRKISKSDRIFLNNIKPEQAREFLDSRIGQAISEFSYSKTQSTQTFQASFNRSFTDTNSTVSNIINNITQAFNSIAKPTNDNLNESLRNNAALTSHNPIPAPANSQASSATISPENPRNNIQNTPGSNTTNVNNVPRNPAAAQQNNAVSNDLVASTATQPTQTNNGNGNKLEDLINKIQEGFNQARDALDKLNVLSQGFAPEFNEIQQRVNSFLKFLEDPANNNLPTNSPSTDAVANSTVNTPINTTNNLATESSTIAISQESYQSNSQANIQIKTRDGDIVTIDLSNSFSQQQTNAAVQYDAQNNTSQYSPKNVLQNSAQGRTQDSYLNNSFSGYVYEASTQSANALTFSVSGNLDDEELAAISNLVGDISKTIGQFEKGNVTAALNIAKNMDTQSDELAGFNFSVQTSEQYRAIDLYQKTQTSTSSQTTDTSTSNTATQTNAEIIFANSISNIIYAAENANILQPATAVNKVFEKFYEQLSALNEESESEYKSKNEDEALEALGL